MAAEVSDHDDKHARPQADWYFGNGVPVSTAAFPVRRGFCCAAGRRHFADELGHGEENTQVQPMTPYRDHVGEEDDWEEDDADFDADQDSDDEPTVPCPYCRRAILEDAPRCPYCERYISAEDHAGPEKPTWVIVTALACLGIAIWWLFAPF